MRDAEDAVDAAYRAYTNFVNDNIDSLNIGSVQSEKEDFWWAYEKALENLRFKGNSMYRGISL